MTSANSISCWGIAGSCKTGWYMDLYNTYGSATANYGEKQVSNPIYRNGRIIFTTLTPSAAACSGGGFSWLMELDPTDGSQLDYTPFDVNKDGVYTTGDLVTGGSFGTDSRAVSGTKLGDGITGTPTLINQTNEKQGKYMSQSTGDLKKVEEKTGARAGRISWRELRD
jgi:type IV pilus assembly protein PilY1